MLAPVRADFLIQYIEPHEFLGENEMIRNTCPRVATNFIFECSTRYRKIPKISPGAYIFQMPFLRGLSMEGNLRFKIDWVSLKVIEGN